MPPPEDVDRRQPEVQGALGGGEEQGAAPFAGHGAVEKVEGVGDHARGQDVVACVRPAAIVDGLRVDVAVVADGRGDLRQVLGGGAVHGHVPAGDKGELQGGVHPEREDELVGRAGPGGGRFAVVVDSGPPAGDQYRVALASRDGAGRIEHGRDPTHAPSHPARPQPQEVDKIGCLLAPDTVYFGRGHSGRPEDSKSGFDGNGKRVVPIEPAGLRGVVHRRNRHVPVGVGSYAPRRHAYSFAELLTDQSSRDTPK